MASSPMYKVYKSDGTYIAACKYLEDAAMLVSSHGEGSTVRYGHRFIIWNEGQEGFAAADSFDKAAMIMAERIINSR